MDIQDFQIENMDNIENELSNERYAEIYQNRVEQLPTAWEAMNQLQQFNIGKSPIRNSKNDTRLIVERNEIEQLLNEQPLDFPSILCAQILVERRLQEFNNNYLTGCYGYKVLTRPLIVECMLLLECIQKVTACTGIKLKMKDCLIAKTPIRDVWRILIQDYVCNRIRNDRCVYDESIRTLEHYLNNENSIFIDGKCYFAIKNQFKQQKKSLQQQTLLTQLNNGGKINI